MMKYVEYSLLGQGTRWRIMVNIPRKTNRIFGTGARTFVREILIVYIINKCIYIFMKSVFC